MIDQTLDTECQVVVKHIKHTSCLGMYEFQQLRNLQVFTR